MRHHLEAWRALAIELQDHPSSDSAAASAPILAPARAPADRTASAAAASSSHSHPLRPHSSALLLKYFNAWFKFANVSQWSRDLQLEHDYKRLKTALAAWKLAGARRRPRAPLSPNSAAAAGVKALMLPSPPRAPKFIRSAQPSDVAVSFDFLDPSPPVPPVADSQRPASRRLVSPDDSARIMFFFGGLLPSKHPSFAF